MNTKIRELKYSDRIKLSGMIKKLTEKLEDDALLKLVSSSNNKGSDSPDSDESEGNYIKIAIKIFKLLVEFLEDDISTWFSDLLGVDKEEFLNNAPFDIELIIIEQLMDEKGKLKSFLVGASKLYNTITGLKSRLSTENV